jgi:hypothetical protein
MSLTTPVLPKHVGLHSINASMQPDDSREEGATFPRGEGEDKYKRAAPSYTPFLVLEVACIISAVLKSFVISTQVGI